MLTVFYLDRATSVNIVPLNSGQQHKGMLFILLTDHCDNGPFVPVPAMFRAAVFTTKFTRIADMVTPHTVWFFMISSIYALQPVFLLFAPLIYVRFMTNIWKICILQNKKKETMIYGNSSRKQTKALCNVRKN